MVLTSDVPAQPRTWDFTIDTFLTKNGIKCTKATPLKGGASCYVWRLDGLVRDHDSQVSSDLATKPCVLKVGDTTAKAAASLSMPPTRMANEVQALQSEVVAEACRREPSVQVPFVLRTVQDGFIMNWVGDMSLRDAYISNPQINAGRIGLRLGRWLACLHLAGLDNKEVRGWTRETADHVLEIEVQAIRGPLEAHGLAKDEISHIEAFLRKPSGPQTITPWDFRPMNTLVRLNGTSTPIVTVVDWEICSYGDPVFDIRLWAAEALVLEAKYGGKRGMLSSFLTAYRHQAGPSIVTETFIRKVAVTVGTILLMLIPMELWECTEDESKLWMKVAVEYVQAGMRGDMEWLRDSGLKSLMGDL